MKYEKELIRFFLIAVSDGLTSDEFLSLVRSNPNDIKQFAEDYLLVEYHKYMVLCNQFFELSIIASALSTGIATLRKNEIINGVIK